MPDRFGFFALILLLVVGQSATAFAGSPSVRTADIDVLLEGIMSGHAIASISVQINRDGRPVYVKSIGFADLENHVPASRDTVYAIGSITKSMTARLVLSLVYNQKLSLSDTVGSTLSDYEGQGRGATIEQLLSHTSGIANFTDGALVLDGRPYDRTEILANISNRPLDFEPGTEFRYSNSGYYLLGVAIEAATGMPYDAFLESSVFEPLGLTQTYYGSRARIIENRARGYDVGPNNELRNRVPLPEVLVYSAGAVQSTVGDVTKYIERLFDPAFTSESIREMMLRRVSLKNGATITYLPAGLAEADSEGGIEYYHVGATMGFSAFAGYWPEKKLSMAILMNTLSPEVFPYAVSRKILRRFLDLPTRKALNLALSEDDISHFAGTYRLNTFTNKGSGPISSETYLVTIVQEDRELVAQISPTENVEAVDVTPLFYQGDGVFFSKKNDEETYSFHILRDGKTELIIDAVTVFRGLRQD